MLKKALQKGKATKIPPGFRQFRIKGHTHIECCSIIHTEHGDYPCCFSKRKDSLPKNIPLEESLSHKCFNNTLDMYLEPKSQNEENIHSEPSEIIINKLAWLTGKHGISLETAVGKLMRNLILTAIRIGQQNPAVDAEILIPAISRKTFTRNLIKQGKALYEEYKKKVSRIQIYLFKCRWWKAWVNELLRHHDYKCSFATQTNNL